ncbi:hypothetical protein [Streptomyces sp. NPDC056105]|uniref:hypothetical protein n=1 Tax=Streptomyces sp. NPDC056105 TaxID=3345714 RepID=UPI0035E15BAD
MTEPRPLTDAELLAWSVVLACRDRHCVLGKPHILPDFPRCLVCGDEVTGLQQSQSRDTLQIRMTMHPCNHGHTAEDGQLMRVYPHFSDMIDRIDIDNRMAIGQRWATERIIGEAVARLGLEQPGPVVGHATISIDVQASPQATDRRNVILSSAPLAAGLPHVAGRCPACQRGGLFLGDGGHVTCSQADCPDPCAADKLLRGEQGAR